uniref:Parasitism protein 16D10L n=1 Tax=Meloidogyne chitwoodi TaxID=59747 RepID=A0A059UC27_MELCH|nr:parasitism protein 16D10L [Meloidogyne chitwoodi]
MSQSIKNLIIFLIYFIINLIILSVTFVDSAKGKKESSGPSLGGNDNNDGR